MTAITATFPLVALDGQPAGTIVDHYEVVLSDGQKASVPAVSAVTPVAVPFTVTAGKFTVTVTALDATGAVIGTAQVSDPLVVPASTISVMVPGKPVLSTS